MTLRMVARKSSWSGPKRVRCMVRTLSRGRPAVHGPPVAGRQGRVTWYAQTPALRRRQLAADLLVLAWTVLWLWLGVALHGAVQDLGAPGRGLQDAGGSL